MRTDNLNCKQLTSVVKFIAHTPSVIDNARLHDNRRIKHKRIVHK